MESLHESIKRVLNEDPIGLNNPTGRIESKYDPSAGRRLAIPADYGTEKYNYPQYDPVRALSNYRQLRNPTNDGPIGTRQLPGRRTPVGRGQRSPYTNRSPYSFDGLYGTGTRNPQYPYRGGEVGGGSDQGSSNWGGGDWLANWLNQQSGNYSGSRLSGNLNSPGWGGG